VSDLLKTLAHSLYGWGMLFELTLNRLWLIAILERAKAWADIADIAKLDTLIIGVVLLSFGLAINRRTVKLSRDGFEASGGDDSAK
jgi:hypothetical protein